MLFWELRPPYTEHVGGPVFLAEIAMLVVDVRSAMGVNDTLLIVLPVAFGTYVLGGVLAGYRLSEAIRVDVILKLTQPERAFVQLSDDGRLASAVGSVNIGLSNYSDSPEGVTAVRLELGRRRWGRWQHLLDLDRLGGAGDGYQFERLTNIDSKSVAQASDISYVGVYDGPAMHMKEGESLSLRAHVELLTPSRVVTGEAPVRASSKVQGR